MGDSEISLYYCGRCGGYHTGFCACGIKGLPQDAAERKRIPVYSGVVKYFPRALAAIAAHSYQGNEQHNPGTELHWDRSKSGDEKDALMRHILELDTGGVEAATAVAWRALANLEKTLENEGAEDE